MPHQRFVRGQGGSGGNGGIAIGEEEVVVMASRARGRRTSVSVKDGNNRR